MLITGVGIACGSAAVAETVGTHKAFLPQGHQVGADAPSRQQVRRQRCCDGDPSKEGMFALRLKAPKGYRIPPHTHPKPEAITVISGKITLGMGPSADRVSVEYLPAGSFAPMPHGVVHYVLVDEDLIVQVNAMGPWGIDYVNAKDDPRLNGVPDPSSDLYSSKQK